MKIVVLAGGLSTERHVALVSGTGVCLFLYVLGEGWDGSKRSVQVFLPDGAERYQIWSASSLYMQCKNTTKDFAELK